MCCVWAVPYAVYGPYHVLCMGLTMCPGKFLDILAVSCDSFDPDTNAKIGRQQGNRCNHLNTVRQVRDWCDKYEVFVNVFRQFIIGSEASAVCTVIDHHRRTRFTLSSTAPVRYWPVLMEWNFLWPTRQCVSKC